jgi:hypothetical protein
MILFDHTLPADLACKARRHRSTAAVLPHVKKCKVMIPVLGAACTHPITSWVPRLVESKASPVIQAGMDRPDRKKSVLVFMYFLRTNPIPRTNVKCVPMIA